MSARPVTLERWAHEPAVLRVREIRDRAMRAHVTAHLRAKGDPRDPLCVATALELAARVIDAPESAALHARFTHAHGALEGTLTHGTREAVFRVANSFTEDLSLEMTDGVTHARVTLAGTTRTLQLTRDGATRTTHAPAPAEDARHLPREASLEWARRAISSAIMHSADDTRAQWAARARAAREAVRDRDVLAAAGLEIDPLPSEPVRHTSGLSQLTALGALHPESIAFAHGIKPGLYLTVPLEEESAVRARYIVHAIEHVYYRLERDPVTDTRARVNATGRDDATHVDLFIAHDRAHATRAREIYETPRGPSEHLAEMGAWLGYPACCVHAFAAMRDRSNNTLTRYEAWERTVREGKPFVPVLNNLFFHLVPFFPCTYGCEPGARIAERVLAALDREAPGAEHTLRNALAQPVYYVDHARMLVLEGARAEGDAVHYTAVSTGFAPADGDARETASRFDRVVGGLFNAFSAVRVAPDALHFSRDESAPTRVARVDPAVGRVFPFQRTR